MNKRQEMIKKTRIEEYNCAGYALGTFDWYMPEIRGFYSTLKDFYLSVAKILEDFPRLKPIKNISEAKSGQIVIAFRTCTNYNCDFHFMRRAKNNRWYHKPGHCDIECISKDKVFSDKWVGGYDSPIALFIAEEDE